MQMKQKLRETLVGKDVFVTYEGMNEVKGELLAVLDDCLILVTSKKNPLFVPLYKVNSVEVLKNG